MEKCEEGEIYGIAGEFEDFFKNENWAPETFLTTDPPSLPASARQVATDQHGWGGRCTFSYITVYGLCGLQSGISFCSGQFALAGNFCAWGGKDFIGMFCAKDDVVTKLKNSTNSCLLEQAAPEKVGF